jgi:hypothetical protein
MRQGQRQVQNSAEEQWRLQCLGRRDELASLHFDGVQFLGLNTFNVDRRLRNTQYLELTACSGVKVVGAVTCCHFFFRPWC